VAIPAPSRRCVYQNALNIVAELDGAGAKRFLYESLTKV